MSRERLKIGYILYTEDMKTRRLIILVFIFLIITRIIFIYIQKLPKEVAPGVVRIPRVTLTDAEFSSTFQAFIGTKVFHHHETVNIWDPLTNTYSEVSKEDSNEINRSPSWNPLSNQILYYSTYDFSDINGFGVKNLETSTYQFIEDGTAATWHPNGKHIFLADDDGSIKLYSLSGNFIRAIWQKTLQEHGQIIQLEFSPQGSRLIIMIDNWDNNSSFKDIIFLVDLDQDMNDVSEKILYRGELGTFSDIEWWGDLDRIILDDGRENLFVIDLSRDCLTAPLDLDLTPYKTYLSLLGLTDTELYVNVAISEPLIGILPDYEFWEFEDWTYKVNLESPTIKEWLSSGTCDLLLNDRP